MGKPMESYPSIPREPPLRNIYASFPPIKLPISVAARIPGLFDLWRYPNEKIKKARVQNTGSISNGLSGKLII